MCQLASSFRPLGTATICVVALCAGCSGTAPPRGPGTGLDRPFEIISTPEFRVLKIWDSESERALRFTLPPAEDLQPPEQGVPVCSPAVFDRLLDSRWVLIRYRIVAGDPDGGPPRELPRDEFIARRLAEEAENAVQAIARHRELTGREVADDESFGPFVAAFLPREQIERLCRSVDVVFVGAYREPQQKDQDGGNEYPTIPQVLPLTGTDDVQAMGIRGEGIKVAILEDGRPEELECFEHVEVQTMTGEPDAHITDVMTMVASKDRFDNCQGDPVGYAPGAELFVANAEASSEIGDEVSDWLEAMEWAASRKVDMVSMSFHEDIEETYGALSARDVFFDYWAGTLPILVLTSAGNEGCLDEICASAFASGKGYNLLGVADVSTQSARCQTPIHPESSWRNPESINHDREIPALAMPGSRYCFDAAEDCHDFGGTSAATPAAAGVAALLLEANDDLRSWPEATRAILLAGADYQMADGTLWAPSPWHDGHDGVGLVQAELSHAVAVTQSVPGTPPLAAAHDYGELDGGMFEAQSLEDPPTSELPPHGSAGLVPHVAEAVMLGETWQILVPEAPGSRVRVALAWNSNVLTAEGPSVLDLDLDLRIVGPDGTTVAWSTTTDNSYELVDFLAVEPGVYSIWIYGFDVPDPLANRFGLAWVVTDGCI